MITSTKFGTLKCGKKVTAYTLSSDSGISVTALDLGGIIQSIKMPDRNGKIKDVICGYDTPEEYLTNSGYNGALIGRYANRIKNGEFSLDGVTYHIPKNENGITALHGGNEGFDKKIWNVEAGMCKCGDADKLTLTYISEDGEEGFPGRLEVKVIYRLSSDGEFSIRYFAKADKRTPVAMTNHAYFNLAGYDTQCILDQQLTVNADKIVAVDEELIPTSLLNVEGTAFDFRTPKLIGADINADEEQLKVTGGIDHTFAINTDKKLIWKHGLVLDEAARLYDEKSGRCLTVYTDAPGIQVYSGNFMGGNFFKGGIAAKKHGAVCLETGFYPDTPNRPDFPSCIFGPEKDYECTAIFKFEVK